MLNFFNYFVVYLIVMLLFLIIFIGLPVLGWKIGVSLFDAFAGTKETPTKDTYIIHHHYDNRQVHLHPTPQEETHQID